MEQYLSLVRTILNKGRDVPDRTGTGTRSLFGHQMRFDLTRTFPLVTTKRTFWRGAFTEMLWMLRGDTNVRWLQRQGVHIWDEWADDNGELGPIYGHQWRCWGSDHEIPFGGTDQLAGLLDGLRDDPHGRRHVMTAWNPTDLPAGPHEPHAQVELGRMALAPCHCLVQFFVTEMSLAERLQYERRHEMGGDWTIEACRARGWPDAWRPVLDRVHDYLDTLGVPRRALSCQLYQRSADVFLGVPFNIAGYALLTHLLAHRLGYTVDYFVWTGGDCHVYSNHFEQARELIERKPRGLPQLIMQHAPGTPIGRIEPDDLVIEGYDPAPAIKAPVAV